MISFDLSAAFLSSEHKLDHLLVPFVVHKLKFGWRKRQNGLDCILENMSLFVHSMTFGKLDEDAIVVHSLTFDLGVEVTTRGSLGLGGCDS